MNRERLFDLMEVLKEPPLPGEVFDMNAWRRKVSCGTACCAAGKYVMHRPNCGLQWITDGPCWTAEHSGIADAEAKQFERVIASLGRHFGITTLQAGDLFSEDPDEYEADESCPVTEAHVIARVQNLLASH